MRLLLAWLPAALVAWLIWDLSSRPGLAIATGSMDTATRKPAHVAIFAALALALWRGLRHHGLPRAVVVGGAATLALAYAVIDELHQATVPERTGKPLDVLIDSVGIALALAIVTRWRRVAALAMLPAREQP